MPARVPPWLEHLLHTHDTPRRTAAAYALGVLFGFSPLLGLHTVLGLAFAFALNLNRVAVLLGVYSNLPWILVPYYTLATWFGAAVLRVQIPPGTLEALIASLENRSWADFRSVAVTLKPLLGAFTLGSTVGAITLAVFAYYASLVMVTAHRRHLHRLQGPEM
ncbi:MAG: DUF2062 domain-containing protein [Vicinamibacterales bacterium]